MSPEGMWRLAIRLRNKRLVWLAKRVKNLCSILFHNSLAIGAEVDEGLYLGHHGLGVVVHDNVVLRKRVKIWQGVTLAVRAPAGSQPKIIVGDDVMIGANAVVVTPLGQGLSVGSGARIGAGAGGGSRRTRRRDGNPARVVRQRLAPD